jgi:phage shock protein PspC (stress-responsive transcriptional regulator)
MNKTVNINLGGIFFHIDEDAYLKLSKYLEAIKRHLSDDEGKAEIMSDIEIRISELFSEKIRNHNQVITVKDIDEVIAIMGEPKDYRIDDQEPESKTYYAQYSSASRKLYRDEDNNILGGVLAGLGHYFGIDKVWLRILFLVLFFFFGTGGLIYIILWIIIPSAKTTAEKLQMKGQPVNISNIEKKVREEFENFSEKVNNIDYDKFTKKVNSKATNFGNAIGDFFTEVFTVIGKILGFCLIIFSIVMLASLLITLATLGTTEYFQLPWMGISEVFNYSDAPIWLLVILFSLAIGIPFVSLLLFGFRILIPNSKPFGNIFRYSMFVIWIIAIISLITIAIRQVSEVAFEEKISEKQLLFVQPQDTLKFEILSNNNYDHYDHTDYRLILDQNDNEVIFSNRIYFYIRKTNEKQPFIVINKQAEGNSLLNAKKRAEQIQFNFNTNENLISFDDYLTAELKTKFRNQKVNVNIYIPENQVFKVDKYLKSFRNRIFIETTEGKTFIQIGNHYMLNSTSFECLDCMTEPTIEPGNLQTTDNSTDDLPADGRLSVNTDGIIVKTSN